MSKRIFLTIVAVVLFLVPQFARAQVTIDERMAPGQPLVVIAHRAVGGGAPENSLAGIRYAIERGVDMVEVDVRVTRDGQYILMHDSSLRRTTNVDDVFPDGAPWLDPDDPFAFDQMVSDYTLEEISRLRLRDPGVVDHPVATLEAALDLAEGRLLMLLELKNWTVESLAPLLNRYDTDNLLLWTQGDRRKLAETASAVGVGVAGYFPNVSNIEARLDNAFELYGPLLKLAGVGSQALTPELVSIFGARGLRVDVDTRFRVVLGPDGNVAPWVQTVLDSGAAAVWTRQPDALLRALGR